MTKALLLVVAGAVAGALVALFLKHGGEDGPAQSSADTSFFESIVDFSPGRASSGRASAPTVAERLEVFRAVQSEQDPNELKDRLAAVAAEPSSLDRELEIDALMLRLSDLAPRFAAETALALSLDTATIAEIWLRWAETEPDAALAALTSAGSPAVRRAIGLTLIDVFGDSETGIERIAAALPAVERDSFRIDWLAERAVYDPFGALQAATGWNSMVLKQRALQVVATAWAETDPQGALRQADMLDANLGQLFRMTVAREWARLDADGFLSYVAAIPSPSNEIIVAMQIALIGSPERAMQIADNMTGPLAEQMRLVALRSLAESDPEAAMARASAMPPGQPRNQLLQSIGSTLARDDPQAAVAWARDLSPPAPDVMRSVAMAIANTDMIAALDLMDDTGLGIESSFMFSMLTSRAGRDPGEARQLADQLRERGDLQSTAALRNLVGNWMQSDPETALDWVLANDAEIDRTVLNSAAQSMAQRDPAKAAAYAGRIPAEHRDAWITQVASQYGRFDPEGAMTWVAGLQGQDGYDMAMREVVINAARSDPRAAAGMLAQASPDIQLAAASRVASQWAQQEPRAAAEWAAEIGDLRARAAAVGSAVGAWVNSNPTQAKSWTLELRPGEVRDQALRNVLMMGANQGEFDVSLLDRFSDSNMRQQSLASAIPMLARSDPDRAMELLEREVTDANARAEIEQQIERFRELDSGVAISLF